MSQSNNNRYTTSSSQPYAKLASWLDLCISDKNYEIAISLSCNKCRSRHDLYLDLYERSYKVLIDYTALTSPFAHIGEEIRGDVVVVNEADEPNKIIFWFDVVSDDTNIDKKRKQLNSANIDWFEVEIDDIDLERDQNIGVIWTEPFVRLIAFNQSKTFEKIMSKQCEKKPNQSFYRILNP